jgi:hypothetical protein
MPLLPTTTTLAICLLLDVINPHHYSNNSASTHLQANIILYPDSRIRSSISLISTPTNHSTSTINDPPLHLL